MYDRFRFEYEGEYRRHRATAINSPLSAHRSFYGVQSCHLYSHRYASRIIYARPSHGCKTVKYVIVHTLREVFNNCEMRKEVDLRKIPACTLRHRRNAASSTLQLMPRMRPSLATFRLHLPCERIIFLVRAIFLNEKRLRN